MLTDAEILERAKALQAKQSVSGKKRAAAMTSEERKAYVTKRWERWRAAGNTPKKRYRPKPKPITPAVVAPVVPVVPVVAPPVVPVVPKPDVVTEIPTKLRVIRIIKE